MSEYPRSSVSGAPNSTRARQTRSALSAVGRTQMSRSPVARGRPCAARACAPTMRNSAPAANNAPNISPKSRFIPLSVFERPCFARELPNHSHSFRRGRGIDSIPRRRSGECCSPGLVLRAIDRLHRFDSRRAQWLKRRPVTTETRGRTPSAPPIKFDRGLRHFFFRGSSPGFT